MHVRCFTDHYPFWARPTFNSVPPEVGCPSRTVPGPNLTIVLLCFSRAICTGYPQPRTTHRQWSSGSGIVWSRSVYNWFVPGGPRICAFLNRLSVPCLLSSRPDTSSGRWRDRPYCRCRHWTVCLLSGPGSPSLSPLALIGDEFGGCLFDIGAPYNHAVLSRTINRRAHLYVWKNENILCYRSASIAVGTRLGFLGGRVVAQFWDAGPDVRWRLVSRLTIGSNVTSASSSSAEKPPCRRGNWQTSTYPELVGVSEVIHAT